MFWLLNCCIVSGLFVLAQTRAHNGKHKHRTASRVTVGQPEYIHDTNTVCTTHECYKVAEGIQRAIDESVDPCHDFFTYSCGQWIESHPIPNSYNDYSTFTTLSKEIENKLRHLLEKPTTLETLPEHGALRKAKDFYHSCMNTELIETQGAQPMNDFIHKIGSWSICDDESWNKKNWNVYKQLRMLQSNYYPASPFFSVEVTNDHLNSSKHLIKVSKALFYFTLVIGEANSGVNSSADHNYVVMLCKYGLMDIKCFLIL